MAEVIILYRYKVHIIKYFITLSTVIKKYSIKKKKKISKIDLEL